MVGTGTVADVERTERFADVIAEHPLRLDHAALLIGAHADPGCDIDASMAVLDAMAEEVTAPTVAALNQVVFNRWGFAGDRETYYDPANSYVHRVIERRRGIPITLSIVLMEVGRRAGVTLAGVGTPAHFVVRTLDASPRFIDPFSGGQVHDRAGLDALFAQIAPGVDIGPFLEPLDPVDVLRRILNNLVAIYRQMGNREALVWSSELRCMLPGAHHEHLRAFSGALAAVGDFARAAKVIDALAERASSDDPEGERAEATRLRARLN